MSSSRVRKPSQAALHMPPDFRAGEDAPSGVRVPKWRAIVLERESQAEGKARRLRKARLRQGKVMPAGQGKPEDAGHE